MGLAKGKILERPMQGWVGYIEEWIGTFKPASLPGGVAEKNSFFPAGKVGHKYPVYTHPGPGRTRY